MTVPTTSRRAGPFSGTGAIVNLPFTFKVFGRTDLLATRLDSVGVESVLVFGTDYTVTLNVDQDTSPGGYITPTAAQPTDTSITLTSDVEEEQTLDLLGGGSFRPQNIEDALDRAVILIQQLREVLNRTVRLPISATADSELPAAEANKLIGWNSLATGLRNVDPDTLDNTVYVPAGTGAVSSDAQSKLRQFPTLGDYTSTATAIAAAVAGDFRVGVLSDITVTIPTDAATLQIALDRLVPLNPQTTITLSIASGHALATGVALTGRDCSQFRVTSVAAEVTLAASYPFNVFQGYSGAKMPRLGCLINAANQISGNGIRLEGGCVMVIDAGAGVKNAWGTGLLAYRGSSVAADGAIFTGAARSNATGAGITSWGSFVSAEGADCSNSLYYGAQAAHGGVLAFRAGLANNCYRHGIRATDVSLVDADGAFASNCGQDGLGSNLRAYEGGIINFVGGTANNCQANAADTGALFAWGAGAAINARLVASTGNLSFAVYAYGGATVNTIGGTIAGASVAVKNVDSTVVTAAIGDTNGLFTPTLSLTTNLAAATANEVQWARVGNTLIIGGVVTGITASAAAGTSTVLRMTIPLPSALAAIRQVGGSGTFYSTASRGTAVAIYADAASDTIEFNWASPTTTAAQAFSFTCVLRII